jgi:hypothetical protein
LDEDDVRRERFFQMTDRGWEHLGRADEIIRGNFAYLRDNGLLPRWATSHPMPPEAVNELRLAATAYHEALLFVTEENGSNYPIVHLQLGVIYMRLEVLDRSFYHLVEAIRVSEAMGYRKEAGLSRENLARLHFYKGGRYHDAFVQARAASAHFQSCGPEASDDVERMGRLIADISAHLRR